MNQAEMISNLVNELLLDKESYYTTGESTVPDWIFDYKEKKLFDLDPNMDYPDTRKYFETIGSLVSSSDINHNYKMLSMNKTNTQEGYYKWLKSINLPLTTPMIVEPKIDGISATIKYNLKGELEYIATRGNGSKGKRIKFGRLITGIPRMIPKIYPGIEVRGELYIPKDLRSVIPDLKSRPLRNYCSGILNRNNISKELEYVSFVAYDIVPPVEFEYVEQLFSALKMMGFDTVDNHKMRADKVFDHVKLYVDELRDAYKYETDGVVVVINDIGLYSEIDSQKVVSKYHHYNTAIKPPAKSQVTAINSVTWDVSAYGRLKPVGNLQPIVVGDVEVTNVTLNNATYMEELGIGPGDIIRVERANDVIPKLSEVVKKKSKKNFKVPAKCPSCKTTVVRSGLEAICPNRFCPARRITLIENWVSDNDIKDVGRKIIEDLYNNEIISSISDLYRPDLGECLSLVPGYVSDGKRIQRIVTSIEKSRDMTELELMGTIGIPGVRETTLKNLGITSVDKLLDIENNTDIHRFAAVQSMMQWLNEDDSNIEELLTLTKILNIDKSKKPKKLKGKVCITGSIPNISRNELFKRLEKRGYQPVKSITKDTKYLILGEGSENNSKMNKASSLEIKLIPYESIDRLLK